MDDKENEKYNKDQYGHIEGKIEYTDNNSFEALQNIEEDNHAEKRKQRENSSKEKNNYEKGNQVENNTKESTKESMNQAFDRTVQIST